MMTKFALPERYRRFYAHTLIMLLLLALLTGCVVPDALVVKPPVAPPPPPATTSAHLAAALAHAPATTETLSFTDWERVKQIAGVPDLTSAASLDERLDFMLPLVIKQQAVASGFGMSYFREHAETWGWDSTDLVWESNLLLDGPPVFVLRFRDDSDFAPVFAHLDERGYSKSEVEGATLYSHALALDVDWFPSTEFAIFNLAYVADEKLFVLSSTPDAVTTVLETIAQGETLAMMPAMQAVAAGLGDVGAAILSPAGCQLLDMSEVLRGHAAALEAFAEELDKSGISGLYDGFGIGYRLEQRAGEPLPVGVFVHHYELAEQAQADLQPRRTVAESGTSLASSAPYAELFEVVDAEVVDASTGGANLILTLYARERPPQLFFQMFYQRDLLFSMCGG